MEHQVELQDTIVVILHNYELFELFTEGFITDLDIFDERLRALKVRCLRKDTLAHFAVDYRTALNHNLFSGQRVSLHYPKLDKAVLDEESLCPTV